MNTAHNIECACTSPVHITCHELYSLLAAYQAALGSSGHHRWQAQMSACLDFRVRCRAKQHKLATALQGAPGCVLDQVQACRCMDLS